MCEATGGRCEERLVWVVTYKTPLGRTTHEVCDSRAEAERFADELAEEGIYADVSCEYQ
jgi:hypothetical protein